MKCHLRLLYNAAIRLQPRHETPYATHMPILVGLGLLCRPRKVIEFGSGEFSTALFLDRSVFPTVEEVVSFENDAVWFSQVSSRLVGDARLHMQSISGEMASVISTSTLSGDLIFIDDESSDVLRSHTVVAVEVIFRDGLISLVIFAVLGMSPLVSIAALSCLSFRRNQPWRSRSLAFVPCAKRGAAQA
jgi:hypothetical protein